MGIPLEPASAIPERRHGEEDEFRTLTKEMDARRRGEGALEGVKRVVAVHSGKGGVGKTFLAVNVAYALAERGFEVGILDADVDCPNVPKFLGMRERLYVDERKRFVPVRHRGVKVVSMGLTRDDEGEPFLIRGPAKHRVAIDLLMGSDWGALDFLLVDLPPGTADVPMSLFEFGDVEGILYVTTPQKEALIDTRKSIRMGRTFALAQIGLVENMSGPIFGRDRALALAQDEGIPYLGSIPLDERILSMNERGDIAFTDVSLEPVAAPIVDAVARPRETGR